MNCRICGQEIKDFMLVCDSCQQKNTLQELKDLEYDFE